MAILDEVPGIEVTVLVNGRPATEFDDPDSCGYPVVSKYIEAIDDATFKIKVKINPDLYAWKPVSHWLRARTGIDGREISRSVIKPGTKSFSVKGEDVYDERSKDSYQNSFKFSAIKRVDNRSEEYSSADLEVSPDLGFIQLSLDRWHVKKRAKAQPPATLPSDTDTTLEIAEEALKGNSATHRTSFSKIGAVQKYDRVTGSRLVGDKGPIAVFQFKYRSKESLKHELVIPRTPSPKSKQAISQSIQNMSIHEVQRRSRRRNERLQASIKREFNEIIDVNDEEEDATARASKRSKVTIDLTED
ncbi:hypothetical protein F4777DRAFT_600758 [Nemania sp. FL0916]|nr:hypothetical protein F4777DRAFT_600758 [Nemania sp. FL0916]